MLLIDPHHLLHLRNLDTHHQSNILLFLKFSSAFLNISRSSVFGGIGALSAVVIDFLPNLFLIKSIKPSTPFLPVL